jgi:hypothetical protein
MVQMILEVDNSQCEADIQSIHVSIDNQVTMKSQGASTTSHFKVLNKVTVGVPKNTSRVVRSEFIYLGTSCHYGVFPVAVQ